MINIIIGSNEKPVSIKMLVDYFSDREDLDGILYIGYPIVGTPMGAIALDALLVTAQHGVVIFDIEEDTKLEDRSQKRDEIYNNIQAKLLQHKELVERRNLKVKIQVATYAPGVSTLNPNQDEIVSNEGLRIFLENSVFLLDDAIYRNLVSVIQTVTNIRKPSKRSEIKKPDSRGAKLKKLEASIANLDKHQSAAVIETAEGLQRIRGLAGSGKTIILALKVAYLHSTHPDWDIAVTFNTRTLKGQFVDLITKFTIEQKSEEPDWKKIKIMQAWGSTQSSGIYYDICTKFGIPYYDYGTAKFKSRDEKLAFSNVCKQALKELEKIKDFEGIYDAILIDEAQDLPGSFLQLCYKVLREPKRLIWAYDELQKLSEIRIQSTEDLFGVTLRNEPGKAKQDIILEKCYRNSRPILVTAQALGFGIYREGGLVQMFDRPALWNEIGYSVEEGNLSLGEHVVLKRTDETSPEFLEKHSTTDDIVCFKNFKNDTEQEDWIVSEIEKNLTDDELLPTDIVVINCDPLTTKEATGPIRAKLLKKGILNHLAGVTHSADSFFEEDSVTFSGIYRAKGNEASMVYVINSQYAYEGQELIKKRNTLFTAVTRSKAWVRVCGHGENMGKLLEEYKSIRDKEFKLDFTYPTLVEMEKLNIINRDMTKDEKDAVTQVNKSLRQVVQDMKEGKVNILDLDPETLKALKRTIITEETDESSQ